MRKECAVDIRTPGHQEGAQTFWNVGLEAATNAKATRHHFQKAAVQSLRTIAMDAKRILGGASQSTSHVYAKSDDKVNALHAIANS